MKRKSYIPFIVATIAFTISCQQSDDYNTEPATDHLKVSVQGIKGSHWGTKTRATATTASADTLWLNDSLYVETVVDDIATEQASTTRATPVTDGNQITALSIVMFNTGTSKWTTSSTQEGSGKSPMKASVKDGSYLIDPPYPWLEEDMEYRTLIALSPYHDSQGFTLSANGQTLGVTVQSDVAKQYDLCVSDIAVNKDVQYIIGSNSNLQKFEMRHLMTAIGFEAAGYDLALTGVKLIGVNSKATLTLHNHTWSTPTTPVTFAAKISANQWLNSEHIQTGNPWRNITPNDGYMMMLPQKHTGTMKLEFTFAGRNGQPGGTYTLPLDQIKAVGAANSDWKPGMKVTYRLRLKTRPAVKNDKLLIDNSKAGSTSPTLNIITSTDDDLTFSWTASWLGMYRGTNTIIGSPESSGYFTPFTTGVNNWTNVKFFARSENKSTIADRTATITVTGKKSGVRTFTVTHPKLLLNYVKINGIYWTKGNLVADGKNGCKIGNPNDAGLYFRNGSLVGWKGGSDGSGVGMGSPSLSISVIPANYIIPLFWKFTSYHNGSGFDVNIASGLGDPCQYYLGGGWRTPSRAEFSALKFSNYSFYLTSNGVYAGATSSTANIMQGIFFPASGKRNQDSGVLEEANKEGAYLTSDSYNNNNNWGLWFNSNISARVDNWWRKRAYPVRCVTSYL